MLIFLCVKYPFKSCKWGIISRIRIFWICPVHSLQAFIIADLHNEVTTLNTILPQTCYLALLPLDLPSHDQNKEITWSSTWLTMTQQGEHKHMLPFSLVMVRNQAVSFVSLICYHTFSSR